MTYVTHIQTAFFDNPHQLASAIRSARINSGLTQEQVAKAAGVGRVSVIDVEAGKASCQWGNVIKIANAAGVELLEQREVIQADKPRLLCPPVKLTPDDLIVDTSTGEPRGVRRMGAKTFYEAMGRRRVR